MFNVNSVMFGMSWSFWVYHVETRLFVVKNNYSLYLSYLYLFIYYYPDRLCTTSPEVADLGQAAFTASSDVWALGCVFHELLSLCRPFGGKSLIELVRSVRLHEAPELSERYSDALKAMIWYMVI